MKNIPIIITISLLISILNINAQSALNFDGVDDVISAEALLTASNNFTYEAWVYPTAPHEVDIESTAGFGGLLGQKYLVWPNNGNTTYGAGHVGSGISVGNNGISVYEHGSGYLPALLSVAVPIVGWNHIAVVCNNKAYSLYINGFLIKVGMVSPKADVHPGIGFGSLGIGGGTYGNYEGSLDNFRVWDYPRSQEEIFQDMKRCLSGNEPGLLAFYDFEDGLPSAIATDLTGNYTANLLSMDPNTDWVYGISCNNLYDIGVTPDSLNLCEGDSILVALDTSESGVFYYLRNDTTDEIVDGPVVGNGDSLFLNSGEISENTRYNVYSVIDNGVDLPNSDDFIRFGTPFTTFTNAITVESWVDFNSGQHVWAGQSTAGVDDMNTNVWLWHAGTFYVNDGGTWRSLNFPSIPSGWTHVATVADTSGLFIYYDGVLVDSSMVGISNGITLNPTSVIDLGHDPRYAPGAAGRNTNTSFDDFRVWATARTKTAINANMELCNFFGNASLVQHTVFDEGVGTRITSLVGSDADINNPSINWVLGAEGCPSYGIELSQSVRIDVINHTYYTDSIIACDSLTWIDGLTYYTSNDTSQYVLVNAEGCDSIITLNLTLNKSTLSTVDTTIDEGDIYVVDTNSYTVAGTYYDTLVNANGCDSVITSNLSVTPDGIGTAFANNIRIYPNPANGVVYIKGVENIALNQISILNVLGQDITGNVIVSANDDGFKIELNNLESGIYYINIGGVVNQLILEK